MTFGLPEDAAPWLALGAALGLVGWTLFGTPRAGLGPRAFLIVTAASAAALSAAYVVVYLRGGPRIIDATSYWLEARALAEGMFSWPAGEPSASTLGRFLVRPGGDASREAVIFPPGYPALLALGFRAGVPLATGPVLAAALVAATYALGMAVEGPRTGRLAAGLSVVCAALRYHTADTMSHGLAALCFTLALVLALRTDGSRADMALAAGFFTGWLFATRPASGVALAATLLFSASRRFPRPAALGAFALGVMPGLVLLALHQRDATGAWFASSQTAYYAVSDGPPGCFRYGFGEGIGCVGEHGDFVAARLSHGFGAFEAAGTTLRRLKQHLLDAGNAEPMALLVLAGGIRAFRFSPGRALLVAVVAQVTVYAPFYFDGNYPGGGARLFADVLPIEHVLLALGVASIGDRLRIPEARASAGALAIALVGFSLRGGFEHAALRDREGGKPMFDAKALQGTGAGLVFVDTDHGFNLGFDPQTRKVLRFHGDDLDRFAWTKAGRPPSFRYAFDTATGRASVAPLSLDSDLRGALRIEGESLWPPLGQEGAFALREHASGTCASAGRWLSLRNAAHTRGTVRLELPATFLQGRSIVLRVAVAGAGGGTVRLVADGAALSIWEVPRAGSPTPVCVEGPSWTHLPDGTKKVEIALNPGEDEGLFALDRVQVGPEDSR